DEGLEVEDVVLLGGDLFGDQLTQPATQITVEAAPPIHHPLEHAAEVGGGAHPGAGGIGHVVEGGGQLGRHVPGVGEFGGDLPEGGDQERSASVHPPPGEDRRRLGVV